MFISDDQYFTGACNHINPNGSRNYFFCKGDVDIAGAHYHVYFWNGLGAIGQRPYGPGTSCLKDSGNSNFMGCSKNIRIDLAIFHGWGDQVNG